MLSLDDKEYPYYLSQAYFLKTGEKLNLRKPKTLNEKIQWLKLYDNLPIKTTLTDKVLVRDWIKTQIGDEYLKPVLWIGDSFDDIPFSSLPNSFIIKVNHGCKWHVVVKNKNEYLSTQQTYNFSRNLFWLNQTYFGWSDFETQYKNIIPKIIIEELLYDKNVSFQIWCFNGKPLISRVFNGGNITSLDENLENINIKFLTENKYGVTYFIDCVDILKNAIDLSKKLSKDFKLVRVDWMVYNNKLYFEEMTFTPLSGFIFFAEKQDELQLRYGKMLVLK